METWDAIRSRRNVRDYDDRPIADADLDRILDAGRRAPSAINWQPWSFVVVTGRIELQRLAELAPGASHVGRAAVAVAVVAPLRTDERRDWVQFDLGQAIMSMMLAAADLGIGSGHASVKEHDLARSLLGHPADHFCPYVVALGYPAGRPLTPIRNPSRRPLDEVVHRGRW
jgi:nitroreductase